MKILLDTQAFLWISANDSRLSPKAKKTFLNTDNEFVFSLASIWEIAIKTSLGKLQLQQSLERFILHQLQANFISQLEVSFRHVIKVASLPFHHRDPFDRLLAAQSLEENIPILSSDSVFDLYEVTRLW